MVYKMIRSSPQRPGRPGIFLPPAPGLWLMFPVFSSQLSPAVSGRDEEETVPVISPPNRREVSDSAQPHGMSERGFLFLSKGNLGSKIRLQRFPKLGSSCKLIYLSNISMNFIKYSLHTKKHGLQDKDLYLWSSPMHQTLKKVPPVCSLMFTTYRYEAGSLLPTGRNRNTERWTNNLYKVIQQDRKWWSRGLNLWRMSWEPKCLTAMFSFLTRCNHILWGAPTLVQEPEKRTDINTQCNLCSIKVWTEHYENTEEGGSYSTGENPF